MRGGWWGRSDVPMTTAISPAATEESLLRRQAEMLESELRWIRGRLDDIGGSSAAED
jgi:hypothetical protein